MTAQSDAAGTSTASWRRFLKYAAGIVAGSALLVFLAAFLHGLWPRVLEEFHPVDSDAVLVELGQGQWTVDSRGLRAYGAEISLAAEEPFELTMSHRGPIGFRDGERVLLDGAKTTPIGTLRPRERLVGHNYTLKVGMLASVDGRFAVEGDTGESFESDLLAGTEFESVHELDHMKTGNASRLLGKSVGWSYPSLHFVPSESASQSFERVEFQIWLEMVP